MKDTLRVDIDGMITPMHPRAPISQEAKEAIKNEIANFIEKNYEDKEEGEGLAWFIRTLEVRDAYWFLFGLIS